MRRVAMVLLLACLIPLSVRAAEEHFETIDAGEEMYQDVTVTSVTATDIYFTHSRGMGNAKIKNLSPELQQHFGFDPAKASAVEQNRRAGSAAFSFLMQHERELDFQRAAEARKKAAEEELIAEQQRLREEARLAELAKSNEKAPEFVVEKWLTPEPERAGKFVLIDFWATWCGPCRKSIPHLNALHQKFSDQLVIIGMSSESESDVRRMTEPRMEYHSAIDTKGRMAAQVGVTSIPRVLLVDPSGFIRYEGHPGSLTESQIESVLKTAGS